MAELIPIHDPADPRVAPYMNVRDRDLADSHGARFVAEGESVIRVLLTASRLPAESLLVAENRVRALEPLFAPTNLPVYVASRAVMDTIVGFPIHRGMLAIGRRSEPATPNDLLSERPPLVVGLLGIANHDNAGGIFRNAAAFGAGAVLLDDTSCDPLYRKALRVSVGGVLRVPFARVGPAATLVERLTRHGYLVVGLSPKGTHTLAELRADTPAERPVALLLGAEGPGLPPEILASTETARIDMAGGFDSLNVATTAGIALYELSRR